MLYLLGGTIKGKNVLFLNKDNSLIGSENLADAKKLLTNLNGYHIAGVTWSASATLWWMSFKPKLIIFEDLIEVERALLDKKVQRYSNISGSIIATELKADFIIKIAEECSLIDGRIETAKPFYEKV